MCGCYDVADFVCFLTFFITALVALLSVQYLVVFLDSFSTNAQGRPSFLLTSLYFWAMTLLGCMVFAGIQRRSVALLKWPGRLLVFLLISGVIVVTAYLWIVDRMHHSGVHDLEGKTIKLGIMLFVVISYYIAIHRLMLTIENPMMQGTQSVHTLEDDSDQLTPPAIIQDFMKKRGKGRKCNKFGKSGEEISRPINVASDGINYYVVLLESPYKNGDLRYATTTTTKSRMASDKKATNHYRRRFYEDVGDADEEDNGSCSSITEV